MDSQTHTHPPNRALNCESLIYAWGQSFCSHIVGAAGPGTLAYGLDEPYEKHKPFFLVFTVWNSCAGKFNSELCLHKNQHKMLPTLVQPT